MVNIFKVLKNKKLLLIKMSSSKRKRSKDKRKRSRSKKLLKSKLLKQKLKVLNKGIDNCLSFNLLLERQCPVSHYHWQYHWQFYYSR